VYSWYINVIISLTGGRYGRLDRYHVTQH